MAEPLKNRYNKLFFQNLTQTISEIDSSFDSTRCLQQIFTEDWILFEFKQRMKHISNNLAQLFNQDFSISSEAIVKLTIALAKTKTQLPVEYLFLPDLIQSNGIPHFELSFQAMETITQYISCEFAVRPFIKSDEERSMKKLLEFSLKKNHHVRRLASEGCRPRLPWANGLPKFKKNPTLIIPILDNLKMDSSEYVRRSVANNLNDISKENPLIVLDLVEKWKNISPQTDWIIKHGLRTLLKKGNNQALSIIGFESNTKVRTVDIQIKNSKISIGDYLEFSFILQNNNNIEIKLRLEYAIYYQKANGSLASKVYKISEKSYSSNSNAIINRRQSFKPISTRKFHLGLHQLSVIVNGVESDKINFYLV